MNKLAAVRRAAIVKALVEGSSIRATARMVGCDKDTVMKLLVEVGEFASVYQHHSLTNLPCTVVECDEIWSFVGAKQANATKEGQGDLWTFTAICADTKLMVSYLVGPRTHASTQAFMNDVAARLPNRVQINTDGFPGYLNAVESAFGLGKAAHAVVKKLYKTEGDQYGRGRYSPAAVVTGIEKTAISGRPDMDRASTSYVERSNLTMRMSMRRFTRLTNGFSKKAENHAHAVSLHFMFYNYCRPHQTLTKAAEGVKTTPAMAAGITDHVWTVEEILGMMRPDYLLHSN